MGETDFELGDKTEIVERDGSTSPTDSAGFRRFKKDEAILARFGKRQQLRVSSPERLTCATFFNMFGPPAEFLTERLRAASRHWAY